MSTVPAPRRMSLQLQAELWRPCDSLELHSNSNPRQDLKGATGAGWAELILHGNAMSPALLTSPFLPIGSHARR